MEDMVEELQCGGIGENGGNGEQPISGDEK
jgi:hypothetical protein